MVVFKSICIRIGNKPEKDMHCVCISLLKASLVSVENGCLTKNKTICYCWNESDVWYLAFDTGIWSILFTFRHDIAKNRGPVWMKGYLLSTKKDLWPVTNHLVIKEDDFSFIDRSFRQERLIVQKYFLLSSPYPSKVSKSYYYGSFKKIR